MSLLNILCLPLLLAFILSQGRICAGANIPIKIVFADAALKDAVITASDAKIPNTTVTYEVVSISATMPGDLTSQEAAFNKLNGKGYTAIVHYCSYNILLAAYRASIPYFIINDGSCDSWQNFPSNVFKLDIPKDLRPLATKALLTHYRVTQQIIVTDFGREAKNYFPHLQEEYQSMSAVDNNSTDAQIQANLIRAKQRLGETAASFLVLTDSKNSTLFHAILKQGLICGLLRPTMKWFLPTYRHSIFELAKDFLLSGGMIVALEDKVGGLSKSIQGNKIEMANLAIKYIVNVYGRKGGDPLITLKQGQYKNGNDTLAFDQVTGELKNTKSFVSVVQDRTLTHEKFIFDGKKLILHNADYIDPNDWKIAVIPNSNFYNRSSTNQVTGFAVDLIKEVLKVNPQVIYSFVFPNMTGNDNSGDISGQWESIIELLRTEKADVAFMPVAVVGNWYSLVDFATPTFGEVGINMLMAEQNQTEIQRVLWYITAPFSLNVWIACAVTFVLLAFVLWVTDKISPNYGGKGNFGVLDSIFFISAAFMMAKLDVKPRMMSVRIFNLLLWFATLIMMASYAGSLFQYILNKPPYIPVNSFESAYSYGGAYKWFWRPTLMSWQFFEKSATQDPNGNIAKMVALANRSWPQEMLQTNVTRIEEMLKTPSWISIGDTMTHQFMAMKNCQLKTRGQSLNVLSTAFPTRKNWNGKTLFDQIHLQLVKSTTIRQLKQKYFEFNSCLRTSSGEAGTIDQMGVFDVIGIFLLLGAGVVIAIIVGIFEFMIYKANLSCQRFTGGGLDFGKSYNMKVVLLEPDGIWVEIPGDKRNYFVKADQLHPGRDIEVSPADLGIQVKSKIKLAYFGNDPKSGERIFRRPY